MLFISQRLKLSMLLVPPENLRLLKLDDPSAMAPPNMIPNNDGLLMVEDEMYQDYFREPTPQAPSSSSSSFISMTDVSQQGHGPIFLWKVSPYSLFCLVVAVCKLIIN